MAPAATRAPIDLALAAAWAVAALVAGLLDAPLAILLPLGLPLVLLLPGYAITCITHPAEPRVAPPAAAEASKAEAEAALQDRHRSLGFGDRALLGIVFSVITTATVGLVLAALPVGITRTSVAMTLAGAVLFGLALALVVRLADTPKDRRPAFPLPRLGGRPWYEWLSVVGLVATLAVLAVSASAFVRDVSDDGYVSLFLEPNVRVECYPLRFTGGEYAYNTTGGRCPNAIDPVSVVVNNHHGEAVDYVLRIGWSQQPGPETGIAVVTSQTSGRLEPVAEGIGLEHQLVELLNPGAPPYPGLQYLKVQLFLGTGVSGDPDHAVQLRIVAD